MTMAGPSFKQRAAPRKASTGLVTASQGGVASRLPKGAGVTLHEARTLTGLGAWPVDQVISLFASSADAQGQLDRASFARLFTRVLMNSCKERAAAAARARARERSGGVMGRGENGGGGGGGGVDVAELRAAWTRQQRGAAVVEALFTILDIKGAGVLRAPELAAAASVLCGGTREGRLRAAFAAHDGDGDGLLTQAELELYLCSVFALVYETQSGTEEKMGVGWRELGNITAGSAFEQLQAKRRGQHKPSAMQTEATAPEWHHPDGTTLHLPSASASTGYKSEERQQGGMTFEEFLLWCDGEGDGGLSAALSALSVSTPNLSSPRSNPT